MSNRLLSEDLFGSRCCVIRFYGIIFEVILVSVNAETSLKRQRWSFRLNCHTYVSAKRMRSNMCDVEMNDIVVLYKIGILNKILLTLSEGKNFQTTAIYVVNQWTLSLCNRSAADECHVV